MFASVDVRMSESWGLRLAQVMRLRKKTLRSVAEAVGCSIQAVHKWRNGGEIEHEKLLRLAGYLGVHWLWLKHEIVGVPHPKIVGAEVDQRADKIVRALIFEYDEYADLAMDSMGVFEIDLVRGGGYWNTVLQQFVGAPSGAPFSRQHFRDAIDPCDLPFVERALQQAVISKNSVKQRLHFKRHIGDEFLLRIKPQIKGDRVVALYGLCWRCVRLADV